MLTHIVVDDLPVCGAFAPYLPAARASAATCAACRAVLLYLGAPASVLLEEDPPPADDAEISAELALAQPGPAPRASRPGSR